MDVDMDLDLTVDAPEEMYNDPVFEEAPAQAEIAAEPTAQINPFDGSVAGAADIAFEKIHIRGLDNLDNAQLKSYMNTYFPSDHFQKIEWIDDTSANFVYNSTSAAAEALVAFTNSDLVDVSTLNMLQMRQARPLQATSRDGDIENHDLEIRMATTSDVKKRGAHDSSRFYLMHPEKDPREQRFREKRDRIHRNVENGDYRRMNFDDRERKRRRDAETFDESMYDEDAGVRSADDDDRRKRVRFGARRDQRDLFEGKNAGRLRDRSASPMRGDGDGRYGFGTDPDTPHLRHRIRQRSSSPPRRHPGNAGKELFTPKSLQPAAPIELFPNKTTSSNSGQLSGGGTHSHSSSMELFPDKVRKSHHRRSGAIDASPERFVHNGHERPRSLADRITAGSSLADRISGGGGRPGSSSGNGVGGGGGSLADRITMPRGGSSLADRITRDGEDGGISIRGQGSGISIKGNSGISIKGQADASEGLSIKGASGGGAVKELFPVKAAGTGGNAGKELFGEKLKGRGLARRTAASYY